MGLLSALGKIGKGIGKVGASLIPGGSLVADAIETGAELMGGGASAAKDGRINEAALQGQMNAANNRANLEASTFNAGREGGLIRRALAARMMQDRPGPTDPRDKFGGGTTSPELQAMLAKYGQMADQDVMSGGYKVHPTMSVIPKSGAMEKIGGAIGVGGGILGALGRLKPPSVDTPQDMGRQSMAPNLPYQPLPRAEPYLQAKRNVPMTGRLV